MAAMDEIERQVWSYLPGKDVMQRCSVREVSASRGFDVATFPDLVETVAAIGYANRRHNLFFRGQDADYTLPSRGKYSRIASALPSIFRPAKGKKILSSDLLEDRFVALDGLSDQVAATYSRSELFGGWKRIGRYEELRWALLQHYQVCDTPLIDVTQSLRVAASFATASNRGKYAYLHVYGLPHINGSISYHVDDSLVVIKLQSICPPAAKRAHYQEGFLVGHFPETRERTKDVNLAYRMVAKLRLRKDGFWNETAFPAIPWSSLMPEVDALKGYFADVKERYRKLARTP